VLCFHHEVGMEEELERTGELGFQHTLFVDEELLEDSLVHLSP